MELRFIASAAKRMRLSPPTSLYQIQHRLTSHSSSSPDKPPQQAIPVGDYYSWILSKPPDSFTPYTLPQKKPGSQASTAEDPPPKVLDTNPATASNPDPAILFASRTVKLRERQDDRDKKSIEVAGVKIPPKPEEPDDCCMSGCVNCVWDRYQDEMEDYLGAKRLADQALIEVKAREGGKDRADTAAASMDDDGGGSESNREVAADAASKSEDMFKDVPVGIREFMRLEKALKDKMKSP